jgi:hypothetical protein
MNIDRYTVVESNNHQELITLVNEMLDKGWFVQGGISYYPGGFVQAMVSNESSLKNAALGRD